MKVLIRKVDNSRAEIRKTLTRLHRETFPYDDMYDFEQGYWWVAYCGITPVGFAGIVPSARWRKTGYMCRAGVCKMFRGKGLQKRLIKARILQAKRLKWTHIITDTTNNIPSANSLISCGFKLYDPLYPWACADSIYWIYKINAR